VSSQSPALSTLPRDLGKALVVDDDPVVRSLYAEVLEAMGFQVETASDGQQGLERIQASPYNLIITDLRMPALTGFEMFEKAATVRPGSQEQFIFTTGLLDSLSTHEYMVATEKPCILKPATVEGIQEAVLEFIGRRGSTSS